MALANVSYADMFARVPENAKIIARKVTEHDHVDKLRDNEKIIHLVRHGQATHNCECEQASAYNVV